MQFIIPRILDRPSTRMWVSIRTWHGGQYSSIDGMGYHFSPLPAGSTRHGHLGLLRLWSMAPHGVVPARHSEIPIILACAAWGKAWSNSHIKFNVVNPFPATEQLLCSFLANEGLTPQTGKSLSCGSSQYANITLRLPDPRESSSLPVLKRVQAGISRVRMFKGSASRIRLRSPLISWAAFTRR